jgi:hypothetical protein
MRERSSRPNADNRAADAPVSPLADSQTETQPDNRDVAARQQAARLLGSIGGKKGGPARARKLSKERRAQIAKKAASVRWKNDKHR